MKINRILKKDDKNVLIYLENEDKLIIALDVFYKSGLRINDEISDDRFSILVQENKKYYLLQRALRLLSRRMHSAFELKNKLMKKDYEPELIQQVLTYLRNQELLDDKKFAELFVDEKIKTKKWGKKKLLAELYRRGIDRDICNQILQTVDNDILEKSALVIGQKKFDNLNARNFDLQTKKKKLFTFLNSKGYDYQTIKLVCDKIINNDD